MWAGADPELIALCDREAAHGNFRAWAKITHHLTVDMKELGSEGVEGTAALGLQQARPPPGRLMPAGLPPVTLIWDRFDDLPHTLAALDSVAAAAERTRRSIRLDTLPIRVNMNVAPHPAHRVD